MDAVGCWCKRTGMVENHARHVQIFVHVWSTTTNAPSMEREVVVVDVVATEEHIAIGSKRVRTPVGGQDGLTGRAHGCAKPSHVEWIGRRHICETSRGGHCGNRLLCWLTAACWLLLLAVAVANGLLCFSDKETITARCVDRGKGSCLAQLYLLLLLDLHHGPCLLLLQL